MLQDKSDIQDVLITYATACDYRKWELLERVFDKDVRVNYGDAFKLEGLEAVSDMIKIVSSDRTSCYGLDQEHFRNR